MKIQILRPEEVQKPKRCDFNIDQSELANPFFEWNGWNEGEGTKIRLYRSWFNSCLSSDKPTRFKRSIAHIQKIIKKRGKVRLICSCEKDICVSKVVKEYLKTGKVKLK